jgi:rhomboid protease GluP
MSKPRMCPHCRAFTDPKSRICEYCNEKIGEPSWKRPDPGQALGGFISARHFTTFIVLCINFALFVATMVLTSKLQGGSLSLFGSIDGGALVAFGAMERFRILARDEWWRLVTAGFLHGGVLHILMNSWVLFDLGAQVEEFYGTSRYVVIYVLSSVTGFLLSLFWSSGFSVGASAAACGLIGAMMAYGRRTGNSLIWKGYMRWAIMLLIFGLLVPMVDNAAHIGGFIGGFAIGYVAGTPRYGSPAESLWKAGAGFAILLVAASFFFAYQLLSRALFS